MFLQLFPMLAMLPRLLDSEAGALLKAYASPVGGDDHLWGLR